jgi:hypothetical protein
MEMRRRFVFRGNAAAIGGRILWPKDLIIESSVASSLTVVGGRSRAQAAESRFGDFVSFASASTNAEGVFDNPKQLTEVTRQRAAEDSLTTSTRVGADVFGLSVGDKPKLTVKRVHGVLTAKSPGVSGEPPIGVHSDTVIEGAAIDRYGLIVTLGIALFQRYDTLSKLLTAADDPQFVRRSGGHLLMTSAEPGKSAVAGKSAGRGKSAVRGTSVPTPSRPIYSNGTTYATIVRSIKWAADPYPGATIEQNVVTVPDFGKIFFGELLITGLSRRLTMLRIELGSPDGGVIACAEVENNGSWST